MRASTSSVVISVMIDGTIGLTSIHSINALPLPANHTLTTKLTDTLKSITSNVSTSIQNDIDKVIADTMDITINNVMSQLSNATILGNNDEPSTNLALVPLPVSDQFSSLEKLKAMDGIRDAVWSEIVGRVGNKMSVPCDIIEQL